MPGRSSCLLVRITGPVAADLGLDALERAATRCSASLDQQQPPQFVQLLRLLVGEVPRLGPVVVQLPDVVVEGSAGVAHGLRGRAMPWRWPTNHRRRAKVVWGPPARSSSSQSPREGRGRTSRRQYVREATRRETTPNPRQAGAETREPLPCWRRTSIHTHLYRRAPV
jgi:hypothetical protein